MSNNGDPILTRQRDAEAKPAKKARAAKSADKPVAKKAAAKKAKAKAAPAKPRAAAKTSSPTTAKTRAAKTPKRPVAAADPQLLPLICASLEDDKAEDIVTIDLVGRSSLADALVIASGRSSRHVTSTAEHLARKLKDAGYGARPIDGAAQGDWVLVDAGDVIVHLFRPEVRQYYDLEGMWSVPEPEHAIG